MCFLVMRLKHSKRRLKNGQRPPLENRQEVSKKHARRPGAAHQTTAGKTQGGSTGCLSPGGSGREM